MLIKEKKVEITMHVVLNSILVILLCENNKNTLLPILSSLIFHLENDKITILSS